MGEVVQLPTKSDEPQEKYIWRCPCGGLTFNLRSDGLIECASCDEEVRDDFGGWRLPAAPIPDTPPDDSGETNITDLGSAELALKRVMKKAHHDRSAIVAVIQENGGKSVWANDFVTEEQKKWLYRQLRQVGELILSQPARQKK